MSEEEQPMEGEQQEEQQPKNILKPEQIAAGLTQVCKTHGKRQSEFLEDQRETKYSTELHVLLKSSSYNRPFISRFYSKFVF